MSATEHGWLVNSIRALADDQRRALRTSQLRTSCKSMPLARAILLTINIRLMDVLREELAKAGASDHAE